MADIRISTVVFFVAMIPVLGAVIVGLKMFLRMSQTGFNRDAVTRHFTSGCLVPWMWFALAAGVLLAAQIALQRAGF